MTVNLVGWSRGAQIIIDVVNKLNDGCCCSNGEKTGPIEVNWIGLFDTVDMSFFYDMPNEIPENVKNVAHIMNDKYHIIFPTTRINYAASTNVTEIPFPNNDCIFSDLLDYIIVWETNHSKIGGTIRDDKYILNDPLIDMLSEASNAGVKVRYIKKDILISKLKQIMYGISILNRAIF